MPGWMCPWCEKDVDGDLFARCAHTLTCIKKRNLGGHAEVAYLCAVLQKSKRPHDSMCAHDGEWCTCGANEHNARIDKALER